MSTRQTSAGGVPGRRGALATTTLLAISLAATATACGDDGADASDDDATTSATSGGSTSAQDGTGASDTGTASGSGPSSNLDGPDGSGTDATGSDGAMADLGPARGITVTGIGINQGLEVDPAARYSVTALRARDTMLRVYFDVDEVSWQEVSPNGRQLEARLFLRVNGIEQAYLEQSKLVRQDSEEATLNLAFSFEVPAAVVEDGLEYRVELHEADLAYAGLPSAEVDPVYPPTGWTRLDIPADAVANRLRVVMVPLEYEGNCEPTATFDDAYFEQIRLTVHNMLPVSELEFSVREPVPWTTPVTGDSTFDLLLPGVADVRAQDQPDPDVYYMGLIDICDDCEDCPAGSGYYAEPTLAAAPFRASIVVHRADLASVANSAVHELGHNHNLQHNPCSDFVQNPGEVLPDYPHANGLIGVDGYEFATDSLHDDASTYDVMASCRPRWTSNLSWTRVRAHIQQLQSAVLAQGPAPEREQLLVSPGAVVCH